MKRVFPLTLLFFLSVIIRFLLADYPKHVFVPDESLYYQFAESLAQGRGLALYNLESNFQKFLYSLILIPAFLFESREIQQHVIAFINSFVISSAIFPAYCLATFFLKEKSHIVAVVLLTFLNPELAYSVTFMSENLFFPLSLWLFYFYARFIQNDNFQPYFAIFLGVFSFVVYLCKEIALFFPIALLIFYLSPPPPRFQDKIKNIFVIFGIFLILHFVIQFLFFSNTSNFYITEIKNQKDIAILEFLILGFLMAIYFLFLAVLASGFFPVLLPLVFYKDLNKKLKKSFIFLIILIIETAIVVSFKIYMLEDFPQNHIPPRSLLRYVMFAWIPFLCFFFAIFEIRYFQRGKWLFLILPLITILIFFDGCFEPTPTHNYMLYILNDKLKVFILIFKILLFILVIFTFFYFYFKKRQKIFTNIFCVLFALFYLLNNVEIYNDQPLFYKMHPNERESAKEIEEFIQKNTDKQFIFATNNLFGTNKELALANTFFNYPNVAFVHLGTLYQKKGCSFTDNPIAVLNPHYLNKKTYAIQNVNYVIFPHILNDNMMQFGIFIQNGKNILSNTHFDIFQNPNPFNFPEIMPIHITKIPQVKNKKETHWFFKKIFS